MPTWRHGDSERQKAGRKFEHPVAYQRYFSVTLFVALQGEWQYRVVEWSSSRDLELQSLGVAGLRSVQSARIGKAVTEMGALVYWNKRTFTVIFLSLFNFWANRTAGKTA